jgi:hypothetical protein
LQIALCVNWENVRTSNKSFSFKQLHPVSFAMRNTDRTALIRAERQVANFASSAESNAACHVRAGHVSAAKRTEQPLASIDVSHSNLVSFFASPIQQFKS